MDCPICLGPLSREPDGILDPVRRRLVKIKNATCVCTPCGHIFHKDCLLVWMDERSTRPTCPVCMEKLSKLKLYPAYMRDDRERDGAPANDGVNREGTIGNNIVAAGPSGSDQRPTNSTVRTAAVRPVARPGVFGQEVPGSSGTAGRLPSIPSGRGIQATMGSYAVAAYGALVPTPSMGSFPANFLSAHHPLGNLPLEGLGIPAAFVPIQHSSVAAQMPLTLPSASSRLCPHLGRGVGGLDASSQLQPGWGQWDIVRTPYQQPPPAHTASSVPALPRRINDFINNSAPGPAYGFIPIPTVNNGNGNFIVDGGARTRGANRRLHGGAGGLTGMEPPQQLNAEIPSLNQLLFDYLSEP